MSLFGSTNTDARFDEIDQVFVPNHITAEVKTIRPLAGQPGRYGIRLNEFPLRWDDPVSFSVPNPSVIISGYTMVSTDPAASEFRPGFYFDEGNPPVVFRSNIVYFHASQNGVQVSVEYWGGGTHLAASLIQTKTIDKSQLPNLTWSGTPVNQRVIVANDITLTDDTVVKARMIVCFGTFSIATGKKITFKAQATKTAVRTNDRFEGGSRAGSLGGQNAYYVSAGPVIHVGEDGDPGIAGQNGLAGIFTTERNSGKGGDGGDGGTVETHDVVDYPDAFLGGSGEVGGAAAIGLSASGGSGAGGGSCGSATLNPSSPYTGVAGAGGDSGQGGPRVIILCLGDFINFGTLACDGDDGVDGADGAVASDSNPDAVAFGGTGGGGGGGGGSGGSLMLWVSGDYNGGTMSADGGDGGDGGDGSASIFYPIGGVLHFLYLHGGNGGDGGDGGDGGHIEVYARTSSFGTLSASKGSKGLKGNGGAGSDGPRVGADGSDGADGVDGDVLTCDTDSNPVSLLGAIASSEISGILFSEAEGVYGLLA